MKSRVAILLVLVLLIPSDVFGTQIIVVVSHEWVVIAADSRVMNPGAPFTKKCKIRQTGKLFWASTGVDGDDDTGYTIDAFFTRNVGQMRASAALDFISPKLIERLQREVPIVESQASAVYETMEKGVFLALFAVDVHNNQVEAFAKLFTISEGRIVAQPTASCKLEGAMPCFILSPNPAVQKLVATRPDIWNPGSVKGAVKAVNRLMEAAQASDVNVGPPISILVVMPTGARWEQQNDCADIKEPSTPRIPNRGDH